MFNEKQIALLKTNLDADVVKKRAGPNGRELCYLEGWHVIATANEIFGYDGWSRETLETAQVGDPGWRDDPKTGKALLAVMIRARVRITLTGPDCTRSVFRDGSAIAVGMGASLSDAYDNAIKSAETDATKRALVTFGNQFGLALYDKEKRNVGRPMPHIESMGSPLDGGFSGKRTTSQRALAASSGPPGGVQVNGHANGNHAPAPRSPMPI